MCSKGRRVEYWTFDTLGKGGGIRQAQISRLWLTDPPPPPPPLANYKVIICDRLLRLPRLGLGVVTSN